MMIATKPTKEHEPLFLFSHDLSVMISSFEIQFG